MAPAGSLFPLLARLRYPQRRNGAAADGGGAAFWTMSPQGTSGNQPEAAADGAHDQQPQGARQRDGRVEPDDQQTRQRQQRRRQGNHKPMACCPGDIFEMHFRLCHGATVGVARPSQVYEL
jgi:hypothetical protein